MAKSGNRRQARPLGDRRYKRRFTLICEGAKTEIEYFSWLKHEIDHAVIDIHLLKRKVGKSAPQHLISDADKYRASNRLGAGDSIWLIMDKDSWTDKQFQLIGNWKEKDSRHCAAVSNPKFEYWILLHLQEDPGSLSHSACDKKYQDYFGGGKGFKARDFDLEMVRRASQRARRKHGDCLRDEDYLSFVPKFCGSTLYQLMEVLGLFE